MTYRGVIILSFRLRIISEDRSGIYYSEKSFSLITELVRRLNFYIKSECFRAILALLKDHGHKYAKHAHCVRRIPKKVISELSIVVYISTII